MHLTILLVGFLFEGLLGDKTIAKNTDDLPSTRKVETQKVEEISSARGKKQYQQGLTYRKQKEYPQAVEAFTRALEHGFRTAEVFFFRGQTHYDLQHYSDALSDLKYAIELQPSNPHSYMLKAAIYEKVGQEQEAIESLTQGIGIEPPELNPIRGQLYAARGTLYSDLNELDKATRDFTRALELGHTAHSVYYERGRAFTKLGRYDEAILDFSAALDKKKGHLRSRLERAWVYGCLGKFQKSRDDVDQVLSTTPDDRFARSLRGWIRLELDDVEGGLSDLKHVAKHDDSKDPWLYINLAYAFYKKRHLDQAIQANEKGLAFADDEFRAPLYFQRGILLLVARRYGESRAAYEQGKVAAEKVPNRFEFDEAIDDLRETMAANTEIKDAAVTILQMLEDARGRMPDQGIKKSDMCPKVKLRSK